MSDLPGKHKEVIFPHRQGHVAHIGAGSADRRGRRDPGPRGARKHDASVFDDSAEGGGRFPRPTPPTGAGAGRGGALFSRRPFELTASGQGLFASDRLGSPCRGGRGSVGRGGMPSLTSEALEAGCPIWSRARSARGWTLGLSWGGRGPAAVRRRGRDTKLRPGSGGSALAGFGRDILLLTWANRFHRGHGARPTERTERTGCLAPGPRFETRCARGRQFPSGQGDRCGRACQSAVGNRRSVPGARRFRGGPDGTGAWPDPGGILPGSFREAGRNLPGRFGDGSGTIWRRKRRKTRPAVTPAMRASRARGGRCPNRRVGQRAKRGDSVRKRGRPATPVAMSPVSLSVIARRETCSARRR